MKTLNSFEVFGLIKDYISYRVKLRNSDNIYCSKIIIINKCEYVVFIHYGSIYNRVISLCIYDMKQELINVTDLSYLIGLVDGYCAEK